MGFIKRTILIAFFAWVLVRIIVLNKNLRIVGYGQSVFNHVPGPCKIFHVNGSEDIDVLPNGLAIFSSGLTFELNPRGIDPAMLNRKGILYSFDFNKPEEKPRPLPLENFDDSGFLPHGIDFYTDPETQEVSLFVINHAGGKHSIEIFQFDQKNMVLKHRKTAVHEKMYSPNDVVAVGADSFYITNDRYFRNRVLGLVEAFYPLKLGNVAFYDGKDAKFVADQFQFPNGIDADGKYVIVSNGMAGEIVIYERTNNNDLIERQRIDLGVGMDNIDMDENGDLWIGVANWGYLDYSANFSNPCPGKALQMKLSKEENGKVPYKVEDVREVFSSSGDGEFKCIATALFYRGKLLLGNPFSNLMYCEVNIV